MGLHSSLEEEDVSRQEGDRHSEQRELQIALAIGAIPVSVSLTDDEEGAVECLVVEAIEVKLLCSPLVEGHVGPEMAVAEELVNVLHSPAELFLPCCDETFEDDVEVFPT